MTLFWGALLIIWGLSLIVKAIFKIDVPVFRIIFALVVIYWGMKLLFGGFGFKTSSNTVIFNSAKLGSSKFKNEYNIIFGSSEIDLTNVDISEKSVYANADIIFGSAVIHLNPEIPTIIKVSTVFAEGKLPDRTVGVFGDTIYKSDNFSEEGNHLTLKIDVVFGSVKIIDRMGI